MPHRQLQIQQNSYTPLCTVLCFAFRAGQETREGAGAGAGAEAGATTRRAERKADRSTTSCRHKFDSSLNLCYLLKGRRISFVYRHFMAIEYPMYISLKGVSVRVLSQKIVALVLIVSEFCVFLQTNRQRGK